MLLSVENLQTHFVTTSGTVRAVNDLSFTVEAGQTVAIVGESGSGKSVTAMSILRLHPRAITRTTGSIDFEGHDLLKLSEKQMREIRGSSISMIFQEPMTSLNPVMPIGRQIAEPLRLHEGFNKEQSMAKALDLLELVGISEPKRRLHEYPHQFSGGMRQRVMIAIALACSPKLLIADEPTTALDVTIQAQVLELMLEIKERLGTAIILITHDLGVVAEVADKVIVMYAGMKVEEAPVGDLFAHPLHPYTIGLFKTVPKLGAAARGDVRRLEEMPGSLPNALEEIQGCVFAQRCPRATSICFEKQPEMEVRSSGHSAACFHIVQEGP